MFNTINYANLANWFLFKQIILLTLENGWNRKQKCDYKVMKIWMRKAAIFKSVFLGGFPFFMKGGDERNFSENWKIPPPKKIFKNILQNVKKKNYKKIFHNPLKFSNIFKHFSIFFVNSLIEQLPVKNKERNFTLNSLIRFATVSVASPVCHLSWWINDCKNLAL